MGIDRIKRNLKIATADVVEYCKNKVFEENCNIYEQGKNWYCEVENIKVQINILYRFIFLRYNKFILGQWRMIICQGWGCFMR